MRYVNAVKLVSTGLVTLAIAGCASNVDDKDIRAIGHPEVIYLQPAADLGASLKNTQTTNPALGAVGAAMVMGLDDYTNNEEATSLNARAGDIKALKLDDQVYAVFSSVVGATSWLDGDAIKIVPAADIQYEDYYTQRSKADSVIYVRPSFLMIPGNQQFVVDIWIEIQKNSDPKNTNRFVHTIAKKEFSFVHRLNLVKPGMSWNEQKETAHLQASMNFDQALSAWLENNGAMLQSDFSQDLPQIDQGLRQFFGDEAKTPGK